MVSCWPVGVRNHYSASGGELVQSDQGGFILAQSRMASEAKRQEVSVKTRESQVGLGNCKRGKQK